MRNTIRLIIFFTFLSLSASSQWRLSPYNWEYYGIKADSARFSKARVGLLGIGKDPNRLLDAAAGTGLFYWNGITLGLSTDSISSNGVYIGHKAGLSASGLNNTTVGYASQQFVNGNQNTSIGYGALITNVGNGNTIAGYRGAYNVNNNNSTGVGNMTFYDTYGDNNSQLGANITINGASYRYNDTITASYINNTIISGSKIRTLIDALNLHTGDIYVGKLKWLDVLPVNGSPTFYKFRIDSSAGTLTSQTYSHLTDTGSGRIVINIVPKVYNSTALGANSTIDTSNQVTLGDSTAAQLKTGKWKWDIFQTPADGQVWSYNASRKRWAPAAPTTANYGQFKFNYIAPSSANNPIVPVSVSGWDQVFDELGNVIKVGNTYITTYSGYIPPYTQTNVYIGLATSTDGFTWTKGGALGDGQILSTGSEDPYLVYQNGTYYLYVERKVSPITGIELFTSTDRIAWTSQGIVVDHGAVGSWEETDASSPTVWIENGTWYMFYEGRSPSQSGAMGLATSGDGITWTKYGGNPIMGGTGTISTIPWALNVVPDDIVKVGTNYYLTFHGSHPSVYSAGMAISRNLTSWKDFLGSWMHTDLNNEATGDGVMISYDGADYVATYLMSSGSGIARGRLSIKEDFALGSKPISTTGTLAAGGTTITGTLSASGATTLSSTLSVSGASTLTGAVAMPAGFTTNLNSLNYFTPFTATSSSTGLANLTFAGASTINFRRAMRGGTSGTLAANTAFAGTVFGSEDYTVASSGTHPLGATAVFKAWTKTGTTANIINGYTVTIENEPTGAIQNGSLWVKGRTKIGWTTPGSGTDSILVKSGVDSTIRTIAANQLSLPFVSTGTPTFTPSGSVNSILGTGYSVTITGSGNAFVITINTGTGITISGTIGTINFNTTFPSTPVTVYSPKDITSIGTTVGFSATSGSYITVYNKTLLSDSQTYNYSVITQL